MTYWAQFRAWPTNVTYVFQAVSKPKIQAREADTCIEEIGNTQINRFCYEMTRYD